MKETSNRLLLAPLRLRAGESGEEALERQVIDTEGTLRRAQAMSSESMAASSYGGNTDPKRV